MRLPPSSRRRRPNWAACPLVLVLGFGWLGAGCHTDAEHELRKLAPELPPRVVRALATGDEAGLHRLLDPRTAAANNASLWHPYVSLPTGSVESFSQAEARVRPYAKQLEAALAAVYPTNDLLRRHAAYLRYPVQDRLEIVRLNQEIHRLASGLTWSIEEQESFLRTLIERARPYEDTIDVGDLYGNYANLLPRIGRQEEMPYYLRLGIQTAVTHGYVNSACQLLGTLGVCHETAGDEQGMRACWDEALGLARQANHWQEARILTFYASHHASQGRFAITRDLMLQAQDRCRELDAREVEFRFLYTSSQLFGGLGCWEVVGRGLQRAEVLERQGRDFWSPVEADLWTGRLQQLRASYLAAIGVRAPAESLALALVERIERWQPSPPREECRLAAARVLLTCGRTREAQRILERGIDACRSRGMPEFLDQLSLEVAQAYFTLGNLTQCQEALDAFRSHATSRPSKEAVRNWIRYDALSVRLALRTKGPTAALERLEIALDRLATQQRKLTAGPETYLALAVADELRELAHQLADSSPEAGYALELAWRSFRARHSVSAQPDPTAGRLTLAAAARDGVSSQLRQRLRARHAIHCVFDVRDSIVVRWTTSGTGITCETLALSRTQMEAMVTRVTARLAKHVDSRTNPDAESVQELRQLAAALLPDAVRRSQASQLLLVSPEGFLSRLPFEALNLSSDGYQPLLELCDVAYLRLWRDALRRSDGEAIVVSRPDYPMALRRRYSALNKELQLGAAEAELFRAVLPRAVPLEGVAATKRALIERWERARYLYFACHVVQDPEVPYIAFVPMATAASRRDADAYLELADILDADLSGCELVVLSSCASGAPYVDGHVASPSLGDAFIDAGAHAVVGTFWSVRDDAAARAMGEFARCYRGQAMDAVAALSDARRRLIREGADLHEWAAYAITLGGL